MRNCRENPSLLFTAGLSEKLAKLLNPIYLGPVFWNIIKTYSLKNNQY